MISFLTSNWEYVLLCIYVIEIVVKLSPSKKDDVIFDMILKPIVDKMKGKYCLELVYLNYNLLQKVLLSLIEEILYY